MTRHLALLVLLLALPSCASMFGHATQEFTIHTPGAHESECKIDNGEVLYRLRPPQTITISKRSDPLKITCLADGNREKSITVMPESEPIALANAMNGFTGLFIDHETGALRSFPPYVTVDFSDMVPRPMPRPDYDLHIAENPDLFGMEEFRPGDAALSSDRYAKPYVLKRKEHAMKLDEFKQFPEAASATESPTTDEPAAASQSNPAPAPRTTKTGSSSVGAALQADSFDPPSYGDQVPPPSSADFIGGTSAKSSTAPPSGGDDNPVTVYPLSP